MRDRAKSEKKGVQTIPDECKGVGLEISTNPKRKAIQFCIEDIVENFRKILCRAFLSPFCVNKKTGEYSFKMEDPEEWDFIVARRFNLGAISMNLVMIMCKAITELGFKLEVESRTVEELSMIREKFYELLRFYLEMAERIHIRTYNYIGEMPASINPVPFTQGLFWNGHLKPSEKIKSVLPCTTSSFGYTGLNELQELYNQHTIVEDGDFAYEVLNYLSDFKEEAKLRDNINFALYATPAESLAGTQIEQIRKKYGVIKNISSREYLTNSFHMPVWSDISPIEKQDLEKRFFDVSTGGRIQYVRIPNSDNLEATRMLIERGVKYGFYQGINLAKSYCKNGHEFFEQEIEGFDGRCPICGTRNLTTINRVCGYMGYSRVGEDGTRLNDNRLAEIRDRKCM